MNSLKNIKNINPTKFSEIAVILLNHYIVKVKNEIFRIGEIEFYLYSENHADNYVHKNPLQCTRLNWYFHRRGKSYKEGTWKGLDITLGNSLSKESNEIFCGILIRSLYNIKSREFIEGPCNSVMAILKQYNCKNCKDFLSLDEILNCRKNDRDFILKKAKMKSREIYQGPRMGLSDKYPEYRLAPYRFTTYINLIKKGKKTLSLIKPL